MNTFRTFLLKEGQVIFSHKSSQKKMAGKEWPILRLLKKSLEPCSGRQKATLQQPQPHADFLLNIKRYRHCPGFHCVNGRWRTKISAGNDGVTLRILLKNPIADGFFNSPLLLPKIKKHPVDLTGCF